MSQQYQKQKEKWKQQGRLELAEEIKKTILAREKKVNLGTLTRIYSYCNKIIKESKENKGAFLGGHLWNGEYLSQVPKGEQK